MYTTGLSYGGAMTDLSRAICRIAIAAVAPVSAYLPEDSVHSAAPVPVLSFHGVEDHLLPYKGGGNSQQVAYETWGAEWAKRNGCTGAPTVTQYKASVEALTYNGCKEPVTLYRVHQNGHTWPGHPLGLDRNAMVDYFSGQDDGQAVPADGRARTSRPRDSPTRSRSPTRTSTPAR